jgi:peptide/nickel transport system ATP-binding protein
MEIRSHADLKVISALRAGPPMTDPLLQVRHLTTHIGEEPHPVRVVDGVDLEIRRGETFALLGESGCGKSMTALSLMRLLPPAGRILGGQVRLERTELLDLPEQAMRSVRGGHMGMIFQEPQTSLNPVMAVGEQIAEAVRLHDRCSGAKLRERVVELLRAVGIPDPRRRALEFPHQLSGGMKQRVMIAMALAGRPRLLIADEPTTALDVTIQAQVLALLKALQRDTGMAVLLITHDLGVVAETADRLAVMYAGQVLEEAPCDTYFAAPAHPYSRMLFASLPEAGRRDRRLAVIPGRVPPLDQPFSGCRFAARCDSVMPECRAQEPSWQACGEGHRVRCHLWGRDARRRAAAPAEPAARPGGGGVEALLRVRALKVHFPIHKGLFKRVVGHVKAVDGVSLTLRAGRTLALVGESGCGKTTVGKGLLQLLRPTGGVVELGGRDLTRLSQHALRPLRREMQIVFQDPYASMNPRMLVGDIVEEGMLAQGIGGDRAGRRERVARLLEQVGMAASAAERYPHEFSGGQRQRICIARALAVEPRLLVCDEPTSALDVSVQAQILNLLRDLQAQLGLSYLFITHDISVVSYMAHEVAVMYLGRIVERGAVEQVLHRPLHPYTRALLSAVPRVERDPGRVMIRLEGDLPSPAAPPPGCHFHPRCPEAVEACRRAYPQEVTHADGHSVSCIRAG